MNETSNPDQTTISNTMERSGPISLWISYGGWRILVGKLNVKDKFMMDCGPKIEFIGVYTWIDV